METSHPGPDVGPPTLERIRQAPKVLLHDHLDGGLRPRTIIELADETGYTDLPTANADELAAWMLRGANRKDLTEHCEKMLETLFTTSKHFSEGALIEYNATAGSRQFEHVTPHPLAPQRDFAVCERHYNGLWRQRSEIAHV